MAINDGDVVHVHYTGKHEDGTVFDSSEGRDPLQFEVGAGMVIPGFENAVRGKEVGDKTSIVIPPEEGYGPRHEEAISKFPRETLQGIDPEIGLTLGLQDDQGNHHAATIVDLDDKEVTLDFNHFLAGKTLHFEIEIVGLGA